MMFVILLFVHRVYTLARQENESFATRNLPRVLNPVNWAYLSSVLWVWLRTTTQISNVATSPLSLNTKNRN